MTSGARIKINIPWYCNICWQEAVTVIEIIPIPDTPPYDPEPREVSAVIAEHRNIIKGIPGGKCFGDIRRQDKRPRPRIRREKLEVPLVFDGDPLVIK